MICGDMPRAGREFYVWRGPWRILVNMRDYEMRSRHISRRVTTHATGHACFIFVIEPPRLPPYAARGEATHCSRFSVSRREMGRHGEAGGIIASKMTYDFTFRA